MKRFILLLMIDLMVIFGTLGIASADGPPVQWQKTFGGSDLDNGYSVQQTTDGGYIISGRTKSFGAGETDVYFIKTEPNGYIQWQKTFGGGDEDMGYSVQQTIDSGYIIAGTTYSFGAGTSDVYLIKTDPNGNGQWEKTFGGSYEDYGQSVQQTVDEGYIITGWSEIDPMYEIQEVYLIKTDPNGNIQWQRTFGRNNYDWGSSVHQTLDGGYIIVGADESFESGDCDVYLIKTNPNGNIQWQKTFGGSSYDWGDSVQQTSDGGYIIAGNTASFGAGSTDVYLIKTDPNGDGQWEKTFGGSKAEYGRSVQQTSDGGYIIAGTAHSFGAGLDDLYLVKTDSNGNLQWEKTFGGSGNEFDGSVQRTSDGGYIVAGTSYSFGSGKSDVYLIKLCGDGTLAGDLNCDGTINFEDVAILVDQWLQGRSILYPPADIYGHGDGNVNFLDYAVQAEDWGESTTP
jgi:hypothetical protein